MRQLLKMPEWRRFQGSRSAVLENRIVVLRRHYKTWIKAGRPGVNVKPSDASRPEVTQAISDRLLSDVQAVRMVQQSRPNASVGWGEATLRKALDSGEVRVRLWSTGVTGYIRVENGRLKFIPMTRLSRGPSSILPGKVTYVPVFDEFVGFHDIGISENDLADWLNRHDESNI
jgi:hypothetical protein